MLLESISGHMEFQEDNKEEEPLWRVSGEVAPEETRQRLVWGEGEKAVGGEAEPFQRAQTLKVQSIGEDRFGLLLHPGWLCVTRHLRDPLQLREVISPSDQFLLLRK